MNTMPTVTAGPILGTVPMADGDPPATHAVNVTRWDADGVASTFRVATFTADEIEARDHLAADLRGALADAFHQGANEVTANTTTFTVPDKPDLGDLAPLPDGMREQLTNWEAQEIDSAWRNAERAARQMAFAGSRILNELHESQPGMSSLALTMSGDGIPLSVAQRLTVHLAEFNTRIEHARHRIATL